MVRAGTCEQIKQDGDWFFLDVGFATDAPSSCLLIGDGKPELFRFNKARCRIVEHVKGTTSPTNLVIEAPLSVCFNENGNPTGRLIEKDSTTGQHSYWYERAGCQVMVAAMYLVRDIEKAAHGKEVYLFEGFVSFKDKNVRTNHCEDVERLREVVWNYPKKFSDCIVRAEELAPRKHKIVSAFAVCGIDCGVPPVIKPRRAVKRDQDNAA